MKTETRVQKTNQKRKLISKEEDGELFASSSFHVSRVNRQGSKAKRNVNNDR